MSSHAADSTRLIEFLAWADVNKKKLLIGVAVVAIAISAYAIYQWHDNQTEAEASAALLAADPPGVRPENKPGPTAQDFLRVATTYPGTSAGTRALLFAADTLFRENKYPEAKTQFDSFLRDHPESTLAPTAALGVAACLDAMDKTNEAIAAYQDVLSRFGFSAVAPQAKLGLARIYEAKNEPAQALKLYEDLTRAGATSVWGSEAGMRRELLLSQHPELTKTNTPAESVLSISNPPSALLPQLIATNPGSVTPPGKK